MSHQSRLRTIILSPTTQLVVSFVIPTIVLLYFSDASRLGPVYAMLLALAFPIALELYSLRFRRKPSIMSLFAIGGIVLIGVISVLGLSKEWLALRRSGFYFIAAIIVFVVVRFKRNYIDKGLERVIDMRNVRKAAHKRETTRRLERHITKVGYIFSVFLLGIGIASYVLTIVFITSPTGSSAFNAQYAELRILGLVAISVPFLIGMTILLVYLTSGLEKMTGIKTEDLLKKKTTKTFSEK